MSTQWRHALDTLEGEAQPDERRRLANIIRDEVESLERKLAPKVQAAKSAIEDKSDPKRLRQVMAWQRGSSLTFQFAPFDSAYFEDLYTDRVKVNPCFLLRPVQPTGEAMNLTNAVRVFLLVGPNLEWVAKNAEPGDTLVNGVKARSFGGIEQRESKVAFGFHSIQSLTEEQDDGPADDEPYEGEPTT